MRKNSIEFFHIPLSNILEQIKIVLVIYGIVIIIHMVSIGSKLPDLAKSTVVSFVMVVIAITLKNVVKKPNLPGFAWATLVSFVVMASTYFGSAAISNIILSLKGMI